MYDKHCCVYGKYATNDDGLGEDCTGEIEGSNCKVYEEGDCISCFDGYYKVDGHD